MTFCPSDRSHLDCRRKGSAIMLMARSYFNTALMSLSNSAARCSRISRHGFQYLKFDFIKTPLRLPYPFSGFPVPLHPEYQPLGGSQNTGTVAVRLEHPFHSHLSRPGICMGKNTFRIGNWRKAVLSVVLVQWTSSGFFTVRQSALFYRLFDPAGFASDVQNCCKLCMFRQQVIFIWHGSFFLCYISGAMIGGYGATVLHGKIKRMSGSRQDV